MPVASPFILLFVVWLLSDILIFYSNDELLMLMWPEGAQHIGEVTKRPATAATIFKNSMIALVENLALKVHVVSKLISVLFFEDSCDSLLSIFT